MKTLPNYENEFSKFLQEELRIEADSILSDKDPHRGTFSLENVGDFSYADMLQYVIFII